MCTNHGQCYGDAVGLTNGRVVMAYDHRYPTSVTSARAIVSHDEADSWRDEVYYLSHGDVAGYAMTVTLDGEEMLTMTGSFYANGDPAGWNDVVGQTPPDHPLAAGGLTPAYNMDAIGGHTFECAK